MTAPLIFDSDEGEVRAEHPIRGVIRTWEYHDRESQRIRMLLAREFAEGWHQAERAAGVPERDLSEFETR